MLEISYEYKDGTEVYVMLSNLTLFINKSNINYTVSDLWGSISLLENNTTDITSGYMKNVNVTVTDDDTSDTTIVLSANNTYSYRNHRNIFTFIKSELHDVDSIRQYLATTQKEIVAGYKSILWVDNVNAGDTTYWLSALEGISNKHLYVILNTIDFNMDDVPDVMLKSNTAFPYYSFNI